jgi:hypothetical protein
LKREHKRKFNRSLCGVLLGVSIVLVILGILGIIGIAVYLGGKTSYNLKIIFKLALMKFIYKNNGKRNIIKMNFRTKEKKTFIFENFS